MSESRKYTEAQKKSAKKWDAANLDRISIALPKGRKDDIKTAATAAGESMNQYIINAVDQRMERDTSGGPQVDKIVVPVVCGTRDEWETAASIAKLPLSEFIVNAVEKAVDWAVSPELIEEVSLPSNTIKAAQEAAEAAGEGLQQFVTRAIESRAALDKRKRSNTGKGPGA